MYNIDNKYQKAKIKNIEFRFSKIQYKTNKITKSIRNIYMKFALKNRVFFFCKVIVGYKNEN